MAYKKETNIDQLRKSRLSSITVGCIILEIIGLYCSLSYGAYHSVYPTDKLMDALKGTLNAVLQDPLYFIPINYSLAPVAIVTFVVVIIFLLMYADSLVHTHHDDATAKGSAEWQEALEFTQKYAELK